MNNNSFYNTVKKYNMLKKNDNVIVGLSGGADSVCLTSLLSSLKNELNLNITAAHINHGIRGDEADRDEQFCIDLCERLEIEIRVLHADIPSLSKERKISEEECGRKVRYEFFSSLAGENGKIATAHNLNDNAETLLLNITRGTGNNGLCGIPAVRGNIIRPLIKTDRKSIEEYCLQNGLEFVTDSTNLENDYSRNKIRNLVMPVLTELNPSVLQSFARLIVSANEDEKYLASVSLKEFKNCSDENRLSEEKLLLLGVAIRKRVVALFLRQFTEADISARHIDDIISLVGTGKSVCSAGAVKLRSRNGFIEKVTDIMDEAWQVTFKKTDNSVVLPFGIAQIDRYETKDLQNLNKEVLDNLIDCDKIGNTLKLHSRFEGDSFTFPKRKVTKTLKKLFNEEKILPEKRNSISVLSDGESVVWVENFGTSKKYCIDNNTNKAMKITVKRGKDNE